MDIITVTGTDIKIKKSSLNKKLLGQTNSFFIFGVDGLQNLW
jgi:hypothetical protein